MSLKRATTTLFVATIALTPALSLAGAAYIYEMSSVSETGYGGAGLDNNRPR